MDALRIRGLEMGFGGRPVLRGVDLRVRTGEVVGLTGANGSGKSTLLRIAAGLLLPASDGAGRVRVTGRAPEAARRAGRIGWSPASGGESFTRRLSLRQNLASAARLSGLCAALERRRIDELAAQLGFAEHLDVPADRCSTGVRQRAALARALLHRPVLLLLDEPLRGVDAPSAAALAATLRDDLRQQAVVWVSHGREELALVADRVLELRDGLLQATGRTRSAA